MTAQAKTVQTSHPLKLGDVLVCSWGCEQTNVNFYEVVKVAGKATVEIRELAQERICDGDMSGKCTPLVGEYASANSTRHRVDQVGNLKIDGYRYVSPASFDLMAGVKVYRSVYWSSYA